MNFFKHQSSKQQCPSQTQSSQPHPSKTQALLGLHCRQAKQRPLVLSLLLLCSLLMGLMALPWASKTLQAEENAYVSGIYTLDDGVRYVFDAQGNKVEGWCEIPGLGTAYGAPGSGAAYIGGTYEIDGTHYVFDDWGFLVDQDWHYETEEDAWSYAQDDGVAMRQGARDVDNERVVFDEEGYECGGRWIFDEIVQSWVYGDPETALAYRGGTFQIGDRSYLFTNRGYRNDYPYVPVDEVMTYAFRVEGDRLYVYDENNKLITEPFWNELMTVPIHPDYNSVHYAGVWRYFNGKEMYFHRDGHLAKPYERIEPGVYVNGNSGSRIFAEAKGIDVSSWQYDIDWSKVAQDDIEFAFVRVSYTNSDREQKPDKNYRYNLEEAARHGLRTGAYVYSKATTPEEAVAEADFALELLQGLPINFPVVYDIEDSYQLENVATGAELSAIVNAFNHRIEEAGYHPMVYTNHTWLRTYLDASKLDDWDIWYAYWADEPREQHSVWQASPKGVVPGIEKNTVDINFLFNPALLGIETRYEMLE